MRSEALVDAYGRGTAAAIHATLRVLGRTSRIEAVGAVPAATRPVIYCFWHCWVSPALLLFLHRRVRIAFMAHPAWYVRPWAELGARLHWDVAMGSTGHGGRRAADEIVAALGRGASTFMCPDGPTGPARHLRHGALHMAAAAGVPIVPLRFECSRALVLPRWDGGRVPLPGGKIRVLHGAPILVAEDAIDDAAARLAEAL